MVLDNKKVDSARLIEAHEKENKIKLNNLKKDVETLISLEASRVGSSSSETIKLLKNQLIKIQSYLVGWEKPFSQESITWINNEIRNIEKGKPSSVDIQLQKTRKLKEEINHLN